MTTIVAISVTWVVLAVLASFFLGRLIAIGETEVSEGPKTSDQPDPVNERPLRELART